MAVGVLDIWQRLSSKPLGPWLFSRLVCFKAPYFASIRPRFVVLREDYCEVRIRKRRCVLNHIGTVHAIAMCNMAELAAGTMTDAAVPLTHRWIPKGMEVSYLQKASSDLRAIAEPLREMNLDTADNYPVQVRVLDSKDEQVFAATVNMWVSPKPRQGGQ